MALWWWVASAVASQQVAATDGRLFLHLQTDRSVDVPWDQVVADQAWLDALGLRAAAPELRAGADALKGAGIGEHRQVTVAGGTAVLEVRPDARIVTWFDDIGLAPAPVGDLVPAPLLPAEPE